jgi:hypothetical protein
VREAPMNVQSSPENQDLLTNLLDNSDAASGADAGNETHTLSPVAYERLKDEYVEVNLNIRHYSNLRFAVFSVFFLVMGGIVTIAFGDGQYAPFAVKFAKLGGLLVTFVFWSFEERISQLFRYFRKSAAKLEENGLGYQQYKTIPPREFPAFEAGSVTRIFYVLILAFWIYAVVVSLKDFI